MTRSYVHSDDLQLIHILRAETPTQQWWCTVSTIRSISLSNVYQERKNITHTLLPSTSRYISAVLGICILNAGRIFCSDPPPCPRPPSAAPQKIKDCQSYQRYPTGNHLFTFRAIHAIAPIHLCGLQVSITPPPPAPPRCLHVDLDLARVQ